MAHSYAPVRAHTRALPCVPTALAPHVFLPALVPISAAPRQACGPASTGAQPDVARGVGSSFRSPRRPTVARAGSSTASEAPSAATQEPTLVLFELEGAVVDMHMDGHRVAFNKAFQDLGYECIQWPIHVYHDLLSVGDGTPESLIRNYFNLTGWPTMLATSDQDAFVGKVHAAKQSALFSMLAQGGVPLRTGVKKVIEDAMSSGAYVGFITGTLSEASDLVVRNALTQLEPEAASKVKIFHSGSVRQDARYSLQSVSSDEDTSDTDDSYNSTSSGMSGGMSGDSMSQSGGASGGAFSGVGGGEGGGGMTMGEILRERQDRQRRQTAQAFVSSLKVGQDGPAVGLNVHPSLLAPSRKVSPDFLGAIAATSGVTRARCLLLAASNSLTEAAASAGMIAVAVPRKMAERGSFTGARAKFTGFGAGDCTWGRLSHFLKTAPTAGRA